MNHIVNLIPALASVWTHPLVLSALAAAPVIYMGSLALGRWLKQRHHVALGVFFQLLCLSLAAFVPLKAIHVARHPGGHPTPEVRAWHDDAINHFGAAIVLLAVIFVLALLRRFYWQKWFMKRHSTEAPKFLQQLFSFTAFCVACVLVAKIGYDARVDAFLTGSGIVAVVIGFAMQETLANIVSGIAIQIGKPFKVGDWLAIETTSSRIRAEVVELNWRSTKLRTNDDVYLDIPNKTVAGSTITNLSYPTKTHAHRIRIGFEYDAPPNIVREMLRNAAASADGVLPHPPVKVFLIEFSESAIIYEIKYSLDEEGRFNDIENHIKTNVWYEARRAGLKIPFPIRTLHIHREPTGERPVVAKARELMGKQQLLAPLNDAQKRELIEKANFFRFGRGEEIIRQGNDGCSMFIILEGDADVFAHAAGQEAHVATLHAGDAFGEMCMLTGEKRSATVVARTDCEVWEIQRSVLHPICQEDSSLIERMSELLAKRKMETDGILAEQASHAAVEEKRTQIKRGFVRKLSALFEI
jgi:small-conductance mechanosensitive channel/CRP-like cAMP-binding protein